MKRVLFYIGLIVIFSGPVMAQDYCVFGRDPMDPNRKLGANEYWHQITLDESLIAVITKGGHSISKPCRIREGTWIAVRKEGRTERGELHCWAWVQQCGNDILLPSGERYCWEVVERKPLPSFYYEKKEEVVPLTPPPSWVATWSQPRWYPYYGYHYGGYYSGYTYYPFVVHKTVIHEHHHGQPPTVGKPPKGVTIPPGGKPPSGKAGGNRHR